MTDKLSLAITERDGAALFGVRAQPRSSRERIEGLMEGESGAVLRVALTAAPVEGEANAALVALLAKTLGVSKRDVTLVHGASGRSKTVSVAGMTAEALREKLGV